MGEIRLVLVGTGGVGKSALSIRFALGQFVKEYDPTIEDCHRKQITLDGKTDLLDIVDTAGQEEFQTMADQWYRTGDGFLLVYAVTIGKSLDDAVNMRKKIGRMRENTSFPLVLVGNKSDLESQRQVSRERAEAVATELGAPWFETSAKDGINVNEAFNSIVRLVRVHLATQEKLRGGKKWRCTLL